MLSRHRNVNVKQSYFYNENFKNSFPDNKHQQSYSIFQLNRSSNTVKHWYHTIYKILQVHRVHYLTTVVTFLKLPQCNKSHRSPVQTAAQLLPRTVNIYVIMQYNIENLPVTVHKI